MNNKVVYAWLSNGIPFYIGIGTIKRSQSDYKRNRYCKRKKEKAIRENCFEVQLLHINLSWEQACELEQSYISLYGRVDNKTGILTNMTDGGDGTCGAIRSKKAIEQQRAKMKGRVFTKEHKNNLRKSRSKATHKKIQTPEGVFESQTEASKHFAVDQSTIAWRVKSKNFPGYFPL